MNNNINYKKTNLITNSLTKNILGNITKTKNQLVDYSNNYDSFIILKNNYLKLLINSSLDCLLLINSINSDEKTEIENNLDFIFFD